MKLYAARHWWQDYRMERARESPELAMKLNQKKFLVDEKAKLGAQVLFIDDSEQQR
jgi:hypothetical protein